MKLAAKILLLAPLLGSAAEAAPVEFEDAPAVAAPVPATAPAEPRDGGGFASLMARASAAQAGGEAEKALGLLREALATAEKQKNPDYRALALATIGDTHLRLRRLDEALAYSQEAAAAARSTRSGGIRAAVLNHLGNALAAQKHFDEALEAYREGIALAERNADPALAATLMGNALHVRADRNDPRDTLPLLQSALAKTRALPASVEQGMRLVSLAYSAQRLATANGAGRDAWLRLSEEALADAKRLGERYASPRLSSYTLGHGGELDALRERLGDAERSFRQALFFASEAQAPELSARWYRQLGLLRQAQRDDAGAKAAYRLSLQQLASIRSALVFGHRGVPESFRDSVGATYLDLAAILLRESRAAPSPDKAQPALREVRDVLEGFKAAELQNYFLDECVTAQRERQQARDSESLIDPGSAVLYTIGFPDRLVLLVNFSGGELRHFEVPVGSAQLSESVAVFRKQLSGAGNPRRLRATALALYEWLLKPVVAELDARKVQTLIVAPDEALRAVPFAALFDGHQFLIERYAFAVSPGLNLTESTDLASRSQQALLGGISQSVQGFGELPNVHAEIADVADLYESQRLIDDGFVKARIQSELARTPFGIVSFATHAKIGGDPRQSFLLTYDGRMNLDELEAFVRTSQFRKQPLDLLVLSACDTAEGDERAALGLAGVAVKAGARSVMASLWAVNDASTATLVPRFFKNLRNPTLNKAQALQLAQQDLLAGDEYREPYHWAPFVLIGNWR